MYSAAGRPPGSATRVPGERGGAWGGTGPGLRFRSSPRRLATFIAASAPAGRGRAQKRGPWAVLGVSPDRCGLRAAGSGKRGQGMGTGSYVNGDSGGVARQGLRDRGAGRARAGVTGPGPQE